MHLCIYHGRSTEAIWSWVINWHISQLSELETTWRVPLAVPVIALATHKTISLPDAQAQLDTKLYAYMYLYWPAISKKCSSSFSVVVSHSARVYKLWWITYYSPQVTQLLTLHNKKMLKCHQTLFLARAQEGARWGQGTRILGLNVRTRSR